MYQSKVKLDEKTLREENLSKSIFHALQDDTVIRFCFFKNEILSDENFSDIDFAIAFSKTANF